MNWVNKYKLPAVEAIKYNGYSCLEINDLWHTLYSLFNTAQDQQIDVCTLDKIPNKHPTIWVPFLEKEFTSSIAKYDLSTPGLDKLSWRHLKNIIKDKACLKRIINITDVCFELGH